MLGSAWEVTHWVMWSPVQILASGGVDVLVEWRILGSVGIGVLSEVVRNVWVCDVWLRHEWGIVVRWQLYMWMRVGVGEVCGVVYCRVCRVCVAIHAL